MILVASLLIFWLLFSFFVTLNPLVFLIIRANIVFWDGRYNTEIIKEIANGGEITGHNRQ